MEVKLNKKEFYEKCSKLLKVDHDYCSLNDDLVHRINRHGVLVKKPTKANRWGGREPGNGRFKGKGLIRAYNENCVHVNLNNPQLNMIGSMEEVIQKLEELA